MNPLAALIVLTTIQIGTSFAATAVLAISPVLAGSLHISAKWIGVYTALVYAAAAWSSIFFGNRVHRLGAFQVSRVCLALCASGMLLTGTVHAAAVLLGAVLMGLGYGGITPASSYFLSQTAVLKNRSLMFSIRQSGVPAGAALAAVIVPPMTEHLGILPAFALPGALGILAALALRIKSPTADHAAGEPATAPARNIWAVLAETPQLRVLAVIAFLFSGLQVTMTAMLVPYLHGFESMGIDEAARLLMIFNLVGVVFRLVWGRCVDRGLSALQMLGLSGLLGALGFAIMAWSAFSIASPVLLYLAAAALGMAVIAWNGVLFSEIAAIVPKSKVGQATGLCVFAGFIGVVAMPTVLTLSVENRQASGLVFALGAALSLLIYGMTRRRRDARAAASRQ